MKSPRMDICRFEGRTGWCIGCGRTPAECREWKKAGRARLLAIGASLPHRLQRIAARGMMPERAT